jgi:hypothetical protein
MATVLTIPKVCTSFEIQLHRHFFTLTATRKRCRLPRPYHHMYGRTMPFTIIWRRLEFMLETQQSC